MGKELDNEQNTNRNPLENQEDDFVLLGESSPLLVTNQEEEEESLRKARKYFLWFILSALVIGIALTGVGALVEIPFITPVIVGFVKTLSVSTGVGIGLAALTSVASVYGALSYAISRIKKNINTYIQWNDANIMAKETVSSTGIINPSGEARKIIPEDTDFKTDATSLFQAMEDTLKNTVGVIAIASQYFSDKHKAEGASMKDYAEAWLREKTKQKPDIQKDLDAMIVNKDDYGRLAGQLSTFAKTHRFHTNQPIVQYWSEYRHHLIAENTGTRAPTSIHPRFMTIEQIRKLADKEQMAREQQDPWKLPRIKTS